MGPNVHAQAVLLLTARLTKSANNLARPLGATEWGRFAHWLVERGTRPEDLLEKPPDQVLAGWSDRAITLDRIKRLLDRGLALGLALEKWERAGLWVMTRSDTEYPARFKSRFGTRSPAVLFGCGNRHLLRQRSAAVVGSRNASAEDLAFAASLGFAAASEGWSIVSGGARGIDQAAMLGAVEREGTAIGVLSDSLLRSSSSGTYRKWLMAKSLVLISPFDPEVGFVVGNAMERNKYIYGLSDAAIVIASDREKGGTWNGAVENLKQKPPWVPLWVKPHPDSLSGNAELVRRGARWLPDNVAGFEMLAWTDAADTTGPAEPPQTAGSQGDLVMDRAHPEALALPSPSQPSATISSAPAALSGAENTAPRIGFYDLFLARLAELTLHAPATPKQVQKEFSGDLCKTQLDQWLERATEQGRVKKLSRPARYQWQAQAALFEAPRTARPRRKRRSR